MNETPSQKNIVHGNIIAGGNVHIGDIIYNIANDFQSGSILFLRIEKTTDAQYLAHLSVKSKHSTQGPLGTTGEKWCENFTVDISAKLFEDITRFQALRRKVYAQTRDTGFDYHGGMTPQGLEQHLSRQLYDTFFSGEIGKACTDFIRLLEEKRIDELLLAISSDEENIINLPFEMVLPLLFPPKQGEAKKSLAISSFGLVRTTVKTLEAFKMQGDHTTTAPLKMLFVTALPENMGERNKLLEIEEEQTRLIQSIGALEATGDKKPKIVIEFLENASLSELDKAVKARQHDIVHISGHGTYHEKEKKGVLFFENEDGDEEQITGAALGEYLRQHKCVKLLILSACETAITGDEGGVIEQVATFGIPSIIAMRFAVTDLGAKIFTTEFYTQLAKGLSLTSALAYAREELHKEIEREREQSPQIPHIAEWFTPVVYQNQAVGTLTDKTQPYHLPDNFYPQSSFVKTKSSRLIGEGFIGRKRYLIQMRQAFRAGRHVCLHGLGGLGKTTLAEAFAHNYDNHSHAVIPFRNGNQINEAHILQSLQKRFAKVNSDLAEQVQQAIDDPETDVLDKLQLLINNYLHGRKTILIFDNVEDVQIDEGGELQRSINSESLSAFLRHFCENTPQNCHILFTTRYKIENLADVVEHLGLDKMGYAEQYRLLNYSQVLREIPLHERNDVYKRLDGHPRGYEYLEVLLKKDKTFTWLQVAQSEEKVFENLLLAKVYERLTEREKAIFQIVSVFIARTPLEALVAVSEENEADLLPILQSLQDWSLCYLEKDGRFEVHRLTREWMARNIVPLEKVKEWALKAGEYFKAQPTWDDEILAKDYFEIAEEWRAFANISFILQDHCQLLGLYLQAFELNRMVLGKNIKKKYNSIALSNIGTIFNLFGQNDKALEFYEQSLVIDRINGDLQGEGSTLNNIGQLYSLTGDYDTALRYLEQSFVIMKKFGDRNGEATSLNNIGLIYLAKGDYITSLRYSEQSFVIMQEIGDRKGEGTSLNNISLTYSSKGDYDTALRYLQQSLTIRQQIGDRKGEAATLHNIAQIHKDRGDSETALRFMKESLVISQQIGDRHGEGMNLNNIGLISHAKGELDTAMYYCEQSLIISQQIRDRRGEATSLTNIGQIYSSKGNYDTALLYMAQGLALLQQIGDRSGEGTTLNNISQIYSVKGDYDTALQYLKQSLAISQKIGDINGKAITLTNMGDILFKEEHYEEAIPLLMEAYSIFQKIGSPYVQTPESYLNAIIERIGKARYQQIISKSNQK